MGLEWDLEPKFYREENVQREKLRLIDLRVILIEFFTAFIFFVVIDIPAILSIV